MGTLNSEPLKEVVSESFSMHSERPKTELGKLLLGFGFN